MKHFVFNEVSARIFLGFKVKLLPASTDMKAEKWVVGNTSLAVLTWLERRQVQIVALPHLVLLQPACRLRIYHPVELLLRQLRNRSWIQAFLNQWVSLGEEGRFFCLQNVRNHGVNLGINVAYAVSESCLWSRPYLTVHSPFMLTCSFTAWEYEMSGVQEHLLSLAVCRGFFLESSLGCQQTHTSQHEKQEDYYQIRRQDCWQGPQGYHGNVKDSFQTYQLLWVSLE